MSDVTNQAEPGFSGTENAAPHQQQQEDEGFDMNNNDPNNNTEFNDQPEPIEVDFEAETNDMEDVQIQLLNEARTIHSILRQFTIEEIYSYLEASIDHPQRMQVVMHGFLARDTETQEKVVKKALKRHTTTGNNSSPPPSKKEKVNVLDKTIVLDSDDDDLDTMDNADNMDEEVEDEDNEELLRNQYVDLLASDDDDDDDDDSEISDEVKVPHEVQAPPQNQLAVPLITITDASQEPANNDQHITNNLATLTEMFPGMEQNVLREMYMQIHPIEGERTLDVLVMQMLDLEEPEQVNPAVDALNGNRDPQVAVIQDPVVPNAIHDEVAQPVAVTANGNEPQAEPSVTETVPKPVEEAPLLIAGPSKTKAPSTTIVPNGNILPGPSTSSEAVDLDEPDSADSATGSDKLSEEVQTQLTYLLEVLPNADPSYLKHKCIEFKNKPQEMRVFLTEALENHNYPTLEDYKKNIEAEEVLKKFTGRLSVKEFLKSFPDPENHFKSKENNDAEYHNRALTYLKSRFRYTGLTVIRKCLMRTKNLTQCVESLTSGPDSGPETKLKKSRSAWDCRETASLPERPYLPFIQEVFFLDNRDNIEQHFKDQQKIKKQEEEQKKLEFEEAKARGELLTCGCCYDTECFITDMSTCPEGHLFCKECIRRFAENEIGDGRTKFKCLEGDCEEEFTLAVLQEVLATAIFSRLLQKKQVEEVAAANIEGLENCPFCDFSTIPAPDDKIFHCLNAECRKDSCRECHEPSHIPLRCDEVEKDEEVQARKFVEDRMTEALVRECWKCHKKFVKIDGCNKMTCTCGAKMCYLCRQPIKDYDHFNNGKCQLHTNNEELHIRNVREEAEKALKELKTQKPEVKLKHDPTKGLPAAAAQRLRSWEEYVQFDNPLRNEIDNRNAAAVFGQRIERLARAREMLVHMHMERQRAAVPLPGLYGAHQHHHPNPYHRHLQAPPPPPMPPLPVAARRQDLNVPIRPNDNFRALVVQHAPVPAHQHPVQNPMVLNPRGPQPNNVVQYGGGYRVQQQNLQQNLPGAPLNDFGDALRMHVQGFQQPVFGQAQNIVPAIQNQQRAVPGFGNLPPNIQQGLARNVGLPQNQQPDLFQYEQYRF